MNNKKNTTFFKIISEINNYSNHRSLPLLPETFAFLLGEKERIENISSLEKHHKTDLINHVITNVPSIARNQPNRIYNWVKASS